MSDERPSERRAPGRPREFRDPSELRVRLEGDLHDQLAQEASRRGVSVGAAVRSLLTFALAHRTSTT